MLVVTGRWSGKITCPQENILLADESLIISLLAKYGNCCSMVWACRQSQWKNYTLSFSEEVGKQLHNILKCNFGCDFLSLRTTIVLQLKKYPSTSMSCCSDDMAQFLLCLDFEVWGPRIYRSENKFLPLACGPMWLRIRPCNSIVCSIIPRLNSTGMQFIDSYIPRQTFFQVTNYGMPNSRVTTNSIIPSNSTSSSLTPSYIPRQMFWNSSY